ncbi:MAG: DUF58 domain-containing protein [Candidatus Thermoplasmatota archaeon]|nr:DUF58 domain-containing protein [Candidatus Thermoplasmatota archaeon]
MWSVKARILIATALAATVLSVATAQWFPLLVAVALAIQLAYGHLIFRPEGQLVGARKLELETIRETDKIQLDASVTNDGRSTTFMELREAVPRQMQVLEGRPSTVAALSPGDSHRFKLQIKAPLMGVYDMGPLEARLEDPYGLYFQEERVLEAGQLVVLPAEGPVDDAYVIVNTFQNFQGEYTVNQPGDGFDFYGLREYVPGDVYRAINWKASAKTGDLMVNQFERTTSTEITFLIDGRSVANIGPEDRTPFVQSSRAVSTLLREFFGKRDAPRTVVYGDGLHQVRPGPPDRVINEVLETLAMWEPSGNEPLTHALDEMLPRMVSGTPVILFSPLIDDPTILEAVAQLLAHEFIVIVIAPPLTGLDGMSEAEAEAMEAVREHVLNGLRAFDVEVVQPQHLAQPPGVDA